MINPDNQPLLVRNLSKTFAGKKPFKAVSDLSFELRSGEILGLLGPNGAGKSTTIQMLLGTLRPSQGEITYYGRNLDKDRSQILQQVGYVSGYSTMPWNLTVWENLDVQGRLFGLSKGERQHRINLLMQIFRITDLKDKLAKSLSAGQSTRAMLARAFIGTPRIVLLDEPTASLDPDIAVEVRKFVLEQRNAHAVSMLYTSHNMAEVAEICDRVIFLSQGRIFEIDTPSELAKKAALTTVRLKAPTSELLGATDRLGSFGAVQRAGEWLEVSVDHSQIASTLREICSLIPNLNDLEIRKPTLEDFFLKMAQTQEKR